DRRDGGPLARRDLGGGGERTVENPHNQNAHRRLRVQDHRRGENIADKNLLSGRSCKASGNYPMPATVLTDLPPASRLSLGEMGARIIREPLCLGPNFGNWGRGGR